MFFFASATPRGQRFTSHVSASAEAAAWSAGVERGRCKGKVVAGLTSAVALVPGVGAVLHAVADQGAVDAHVAVAEEGAARAGSCGRENSVAKDGDEGGESGPICFPLTGPKSTADLKAAPRTHSGRAPQTERQGPDCDAGPRAFLPALGAQSPPLT